MVKTRAAVSPTGYPHIGTIYQVLFDYAYARKNNGKFIVRIEDTDQQRLVQDAEQKLYEALDWFGVEEDESVRKGGPSAPYRQSDRLNIYPQYAKELVEKGAAYYCFCTKERLEEVRAKMQAEKKLPMYDKHCRFLPKEEVEKRLSSGEQSVIRLKVPEDMKIVVHDLIRGDITFDSHMVDDQVLLKSDGYPTYHLAVVVDDHLMGVTHMVRGEEWVSSSPKQYITYDAFGWEKPVFFHTPILRNPDKSKFSKRQGHTSVSWYRENGFLPEVILNYLALMGWSHPDGKDIFPLEEFIRVFDLKDVKPVGPIFDLKKLEWMNGEYIRNLDPEELQKRIDNFYHHEYPAELLGKTIPLIRERIKKLSDYLPLCEFFYKEPVSYEVDLTLHAELMKKIYSALASITDWKADIIGAVMLKTAVDTGTKNSQFFMLLRVAVTGKKISPPLNESMEILGKESVLKRLKLD